MKKERQKPLIALLGSNDDVFCFRKELIESLIEQGYDMLISCPYGPKLELMTHIKYIYDNAKIDRRGMNILADIKLYLHYIKLFKKHKPNIILAYTAKPNIYASIVAKQLKIPYINNVTGFGSILKQNVIIRKFIMWLFKTAYKHSSCIMFQNSTNMNLAMELGMIKGDYKLTPGSGVNTERFTLQTYPNGGNGVSGDKVIFNYIGRILHDKGVDDYIAAAKIIKKKYPNTEFNMIGFIEPTENHYEQELAELKKQDIVYYRGSQTDVRPFVARSHATIHPSTYGEGMSNALLESASSGRPLITTDNPGCMETVIDNKTGFIYHGGNVDELVEKIEIFLSMKNSERQSMGEEGREYVKKNFSREIVIDAYSEKIKELLKSE